MFRPLRCLLVVLISVLLLSGLCWLDTDSGSDSAGQRVAMFLLVTVVVGILYAGITGLIHELRHRRA